MTSLTKTRTVLEFVGIDEEEGPTFTQLPDEGEEFRSHIVSLDPEVYEDMGRPEVITVTIEPGDLLNPEAP